ncbi:MAG: FKBP-type peptidyl-prolyl cis-trans isomerase [Actinomycetes bacterium]
MGTEKRQRQKEGRQARVAAAEQAQRKANNRKRLFSAIGIAAAVVLLIVGFSVIKKKDNSSSSSSSSASPTTTSTPSTEPPPESAAGKPCVATVGPLPTGAPAVDVVVGPAPTTLVIKDLKKGTGATVVAGDTVTVNYIGVACSTGAIFDSSYTAGKPITIALSGVIKGWTDGIPGMKVGGSRLLGIPSDQAYGANSPTPSIAPDEALWFVVEVTDATATPASTSVPSP